MEGQFPNYFDCFFDDICSSDLGLNDNIFEEAILNNDSSHNVISEHGFKSEYDSKIINQSILVDTSIHEKLQSQERPSKTQISNDILIMKEKDSPNKKKEIKESIFQYNANLYARYARYETCVKEKGMNEVGVKYLWELFNYSRKTVKMIVYLDNITLDEDHRISESEIFSVQPIINFLSGKSYQKFSSIQKLNFMKKLYSLQIKLLNQSLNSVDQFFTNNLNYVKQIHEFMNSKINKNSNFNPELLASEYIISLKNIIKGDFTNYLNEIFQQNNHNENLLEKESIQSIANLYQKVENTNKEFMIIYFFCFFRLSEFENIIINNIQDKISLCYYYCCFYDELNSSQSKIIIIAILEKLNIIEKLIYEDFFKIFKQINPIFWNNILFFLKNRNKPNLNKMTKNFNSYEFSIIKSLELIHDVTVKALETNLTSLIDRINKSSNLTCNSNLSNKIADFCFRVFQTFLNNKDNIFLPMDLQNFENYKEIQVILDGYLLYYELQKQQILELNSKKINKRGKTIVLKDIFKRILQVYGLKVTYCYKNKGIPDNTLFLDKKGEGFGFKNFLESLLNGEKYSYSHYTNLRSYIWALCALVLIFEKPSVFQKESILINCAKGNNQFRNLLKNVFVL